jgi:hypothetical protein
MPANKANYVITYDNSAQVYAAASEEVALATPPPAGSTIKDKHIYFVMYEPDNQQMVYHKMDDATVHAAEIKEVKRGAARKHKGDDALPTDS